MCILFCLALYLTYLKQLLSQKPRYKLLLTLRWQESIALPISIHSGAMFSTMIVFEVDKDQQIYMDSIPFTEPGSIDLTLRL